MGIGLTEDQRDLAAALADWAGGHRHRRDHQGLREPRPQGVRAGVVGAHRPRGRRHRGGRGRTAAPAARCSTSRSPSRRARPRWCPGRCCRPRSPPSCWASSRDVAPGSLAGIADGRGQRRARRRRARRSRSTARAPPASAGLVWGLGTTTHVLLPTDGERWLVLAGRRPGRAVEVADAGRPVHPGRHASGSTASRSPPTRSSSSTPARVSDVAGHAGRGGGVRASPAGACDTAVGVRQGARAVRPHHRLLPGDQAPLRRDARGRRVGDRGRLGRRRRPRRRPEQFAIAAAVAGAVALDAAVDDRAGRHPGARRHRLHVGARRPPLPAPRDRRTGCSLGGSDRWRLRLADLALAGVRRAPRIDLGGARRGRPARGARLRSREIARAARGRAARRRWPTPGC